MKARALGLTVLGTGAVLVVAGLIAQAAGFYINTSPSVPTGLWRAMRPTPVLQRWQVVRACLPDTGAVHELAGMGYFAGGGCSNGLRAVLKPVIAMEGDRVDIDADGVSVNGVRIPRSKQHRFNDQYVPLPRVAAGSYVVGHDQVWLVSWYNADSLDSRYFGPVPREAISDAIRPVWTQGHM